MTQRKLRMSSRELEYPGPYAGELVDSTSLLDDVEALRARMEQDGYLLLRQLLPREAVLAARRQMTAVLLERGALDPASDPMDAVLAPGARGGFFGGSNDLTLCPAFLEVVSHPNLMGCMARFLGGPSRKLDFNWLRVMPPGGNSGAHYDIPYMGRGTHKLYTCWTPLGDVPLEAGPLTVLSDSHRLEQLKRTYGQMDVDRDHVDGAFSNDALEMVEKFGGKWLTTGFHAGDVLLFGMYSLHASFNNETGSFRLSSDTRYQLASDPVDERWIGPQPIGHYGWHAGPMVSMEEARAGWGV